MTSTNTLDAFLLDQLNKCDDLYSGRHQYSLSENKQSFETPTKTYQHFDEHNSDTCDFDLSKSREFSSLHEGDPCKPYENSNSSSKGSKDKTMVHHDYHDFSMLTEKDVIHILGERKRIKEAADVVNAASSGRPMPAKKKGGITETFPMKLQKLLDKIDGSDFDSIISWQPHGRSFLIHNQEKFMEIIMQRFFRQTKITSFQRQLNLYGFFRLTRGVDSGAYYHKYFLRGKPHIAKLITRTKIKGTGFKAASNPEQEPDFYTMPYVGKREIEGKPIRNQGQAYLSKEVSTIDHLTSIKNLNWNEMINQTRGFNDFSKDPFLRGNPHSSEETNYPSEDSNTNLPWGHMIVNSNDFFSTKKGLFRNDVVNDRHFLNTQRISMDPHFYMSSKDSPYNRDFISSDGKIQNSIKPLDCGFDQDDPYCPIPVDIPESHSNSIDWLSKEEGYTVRSTSANIPKFDPGSNFL